ncbi:MAG: hypothetical protein JRJ62_13370 [Deltaproteobacteria bacterium]|nr:hypothetical protein [Deltaproteobacteria bacterium]MBW2089889.1 hypothetical protein [Deltaproteobacteria bacterium]
MKSKIMFVNDSVNVLESIKQFLKDETYHFFGFDDPFEALDNGLIYRFTKKPWNDIGLKQAVEMAITHYEISKKRRS